MLYHQGTHPVWELRQGTREAQCTARAPRNEQLAGAIYLLLLLVAPANRGWYTKKSSLNTRKSFNPKDLRFSCAASGRPLPGLADCVRPFSLPRSLRKHLCGPGGEMKSNIFCKAGA